MSENQPVPTPPEGTTPLAADAKPRKKKRHWWLRILIALPILLIVLVLLLPTILSLGFVRGMIAPTLRTSFTPNGRLEIADWSFGWFGGQKINGITLYDDQNAAVAHLNLKTDASLFSLIRGNFALGDTTVDGDFDARIDPATGRINLLHIVGTDREPASPQVPQGPRPPPASDNKRDSAPPAPAAKQEKLPIDLANVKGKLTLNLIGTVSATNGDRNAVPFTKINTGNLVVDLNNIEQGIGIDGTLKMTVNDKPATLAIKGTADAIENNAIIDDPNKLAADLVATIEQLDLAVVKAALAAAGQSDVDVAGLLKGRLVINARPGAAATVRSEDNLGIDGLVVTALALKGDTFRSNRVDVPINISRASGSDVVTIESLGLKTDVATFAVNGSVSQSAVQNLGEQRAPGTPGTITIKTDVPSFAALAAMLPHTLGLHENVKVTGGGLTNTTTINLLADGAKLVQQLALNIDGTADGKPIKLEKTTLDANADLAINGQPIGANSVRSFAINLAAPFANISGGGVPAQLNLAGNLDLTRFYDDVSQFVDMGALDLKGKADFKLATSGLPGGEAPIDAQLTLNANGLVVSSDGTTYLDNETINGVIDVIAKQTADTSLVTFRKLNFTTASGLFALATVGDNAWVMIRDGAPAGGVGEFRLGSKLERLLAPFTKDVDSSMQLKRGLLDSTLSFVYDDTEDEYKIVSSTALTNLDVGNTLANESLKLGFTAIAPSDRSTAKAWFETASTFVAIKGDADLLLKSNDKATLTPFEMARAVNFTGSVPSLPKIYALVNSLSAAAAVKPAEGEIVLPPLIVNSGSVAFSGKIARDATKGVTSILFNVPGVKDLVLTRGDASFRQTDPITVNFAADISTDSTKATVTEQLKRVVVSRLNADIPGIARVTMPQAIELTNLDQPTPTANGTVAADGNLQPLGEFLAVVNGTNPLPVSGTFTTQQKVGTSGDNIALVGGMTLNALKPLGKDAQPLPQNLQTVELSNDLSMDTKAKSATVKKFDLVAPNAKDVLGFSAGGTIRDLGIKNTFDGLVATLAYDLPQLWPLAQPFVDPTGESIGKIEKLTGKYQKKFTIAGSYPTVDGKGNPILFNQSVRSISVNGDLQVDSAALVEKGVEVANLSIPLTVNGGVLKIAKADGSLPPDFDVNSGKGRLGGITVDLTAAEPMIAKLDKHPLVVNATLNPIMSNALGKFFNPVFPNATKARALVTVYLSADHLMLGQLLTTEDSGKATIVLSLTEMEISNPLGEQLLGGLFNQASGALKLGGGLDTGDFQNFRGEMKNATFTLDRGVVTQNATFMLGSVEQANADPKAKPKALYPFSFTGNVSLANLGMNLNAGLPMQLVRDKVKGGDVAKILEFMPDQLPIGFGGTTTTPKLNFNNAGKSFSEAIFKYGASRLAGDKGDGKSGDKVEDILGGLLGGDKKKSEEPESRTSADDKKAEPANEDRMTKAEKRRAEEKRAAEEKAAAEKRAAEEKKRADDRKKAEKPREDPKKNDDPPPDDKKKKKKQD